VSLFSAIQPIIITSYRLRSYTFSPNFYINYLFLIAPMNALSSAYIAECFPPVWHFNRE